MYIPVSVFYYTKVPLSACLQILLVKCELSFCTAGTSQQFITQDMNVSNFAAARLPRLRLCMGHVYSCLCCETELHQCPSNHPWYHKHINPILPASLHVHHMKKVFCLNNTLFCLVPTPSRAFLCGVYTSFLCLLPPKTYWSCWPIVAHRGSELTLHWLYKIWLYSGKYTALPFLQ